MLRAVVRTAGPTRRISTLPIHPDAESAATGYPLLTVMALLLAARAAMHCCCS